MKRIDIAIINSWLLTFRGEKLDIIENGGVGITDDKITFVGPMANFQYKQAEKIINANHHITMPGLINSHFHSGSGLLRGSAQDIPEIEWMHKGVGPFAKHIHKKDRIIGSKLAVLEGVSSGTTTFAEYTKNVSELVNHIYQPLNVRVVATETINEVNSNNGEINENELYEFDKAQGEANLKRADRLFKEFSDTELVTCMYGPHALDMLSLDLLKTIQEKAKNRDCSMHMHVAQGGRERLQIKRRYGNDATTVKILKEHELLNDNLIAAHAHDTSEEERKVMVENNVRMASCQSSIGMIDGIVPPVNHYVTLGGLAGLGTDQTPGTSHLNMFREMRTASMFAKITHTDPTALPAWKVLRLATVKGAELLELEEKIGTLKEGKQADIITVDLHHLNMTPWASTPLKNFIPNLVYSTTGKEVDNVIINGKVIMDDSEFVQVDIDTLIKKANTRARNLLKRGAKDWKKADSHLVKKVKEGWL